MHTHKHTHRAILWVTESSWQCGETQLLENSEMRLQCVWPRTPAGIWTLITMEPHTHTHTLVCTKYKNTHTRTDHMFFADTLCDNLYMCKHNTCIYHAYIMCSVLWRVFLCLCVHTHGVCMCVHSLQSETLHQKEIGINTFCSVICHIFTRLKPSEHQSILLWCHLSNCCTLHTHMRAHKHPNLVFLSLWRLLTA